MYKAYLINWQGHKEPQLVAAKTLKGQLSRLLENAYNVYFTVLYSQIELNILTLHRILRTLPDISNFLILCAGLFGPNDESMKDEILKMQDFHHPHVMSLLGVCLDSTMRLSTIMPYMANGSLLDYLKKERAHLVLSDREDTDTVYDTLLIALRYVVFDLSYARLCFRCVLCRNYF